MNDIIVPLQAAGSGSPEVANFVNAISGLVIANQTAIAGEDPIIVSGISISLLSSGNEAIVKDNKKISFSKSTLISFFESQTFISIQKNDYVSDDQTLTLNTATSVGVDNDVVMQGTATDLTTAKTTSQSEAVRSTGKGNKVEPKMKVVSGLLFASCLLIIVDITTT